MKKYAKYCITERGRGYERMVNKTHKIRRIIDCTMAILFVMLTILVTDMRSIWGANIALPAALMLTVCAILHFIWAFAPDRQQDKQYTLREWTPPSTVPTELILLGEDGTKAASWNIYGKNGIVIGRDIGENRVTINLDHVAYASMIDIEHAVLNYSGDCWYIEDVSQKNGISIEKADGRKYKLAYGKPCRLERGDIIHIALTRLQII